MCGQRDRDAGTAGADGGDSVGGGGPGGPTHPQGRPREARVRTRSGLQGQGALPPGRYPPRGPPPRAGMPARRRHAARTSSGARSPYPRISQGIRPSPPSGNLPASTENVPVACAHEIRRRWDHASRPGDQSTPSSVTTPSTRWSCSSTGRSGTICTANARPNTNSGRHTASRRS